MARDDLEFHETRLGQIPIRELGLTLEGTQLASILLEFEAEMRAAGLSHVRPRFYLSTEWGVPWKTVSIAIPFYLVRPDLAAQHAHRTGLVEGADRNDILRYLRHELGHVVNYAYELYERPDWIELFGAITQPYLEHYRPQPWSTHFVRHLPGWYAQKHPDEDWAETFAVWMTPGHAWQEEYKRWPRALAKLEACARIMAEVSDLPPTVTDEELDEDLETIEYSLDRFYEQDAAHPPSFPVGIDGALQAIFAQVVVSDSAGSAASLIQKHHLHLVRSVFTWTGHFPEDTRALLHYLAERADALHLAYDAEREADCLLELGVLVTSLAMNHVTSGSYSP